MEGLAFFLVAGLAAGLTPGVKGEGEVRTDGQGEVEGLALVSQCSAEDHVFGGQVSASPTAVILTLLLN